MSPPGAAGEGTGRLRVAVLPRGLDGLFLPAESEVLALVARGTEEEAWARRVFPPERVLPYGTRPADLGPYPSTAELLVRSDVAAALRRGRADGLLLSAACGPQIHAWARRHRVPLLMSDYEHQRRFEDKLWFDAFLRRSGVPRPAGGAFTAGAPGARLPVRGRAVLQVPSSLGGEGTFFIDGPADVERLLAAGALRRGARYLVRQFIPGRPLGISVFVAPGVVALSAVRLQCYHERDIAHSASAGQSFAGIQWLPSAALSRTLRRRIDQVFLRLGELLYRRRFFGFANFDFIAAGARPLLIECNPRMSAATPQVLRFPVLLGGVPAGRLFLAGFPGPRRYPRTYQASPLPDSAYAGATLDIVATTPGIVARAFPSGRYALGPGEIRHLSPDLSSLAAPKELALYSFARAGQRCEADDSLATILSNFPLYDERGARLPAAERLLGHFAPGARPETVNR